MKHDPTLQEYEHQIIPKKQDLKQRLYDLQAFLDNKHAWIPIAHHLGETDAEDVRNTFQKSFNNIRAGAVHGVPFIWGQLPHSTQYTENIKHIVKLQRELESLYNEVDKRMFILKKQMAVAKSASGVALLRSTNIHSVWPLVARQSGGTPKKKKQINRKK